MRRPFGDSLGRLVAGAVGVVSVAGCATGIVVCGVVSVGWRALPSRPPPDPPRGPNILLITLANASADLLSVATDGPTPGFARVAKGGAVYTAASPAGPTLSEAHLALFKDPKNYIDTPPFFGFRDPGPSPLAADLSIRGYRTGAFVSSASLIGREALEVGFDVYDGDVDGATGSSGPRARPPAVTAAHAKAWIAEDTWPFFVWVQLDASGGDVALAAVDREVVSLLDLLDDRWHTVVIVAGAEGPPGGRVPLAIRLPIDREPRLAQIPGPVDLTQLSSLIGYLGHTGPTRDIPWQSEPPAAFGYPFRGSSLAEVGGTREPGIEDTDP